MIPVARCSYAQLRLICQLYSFVGQHSLASLLHAFENNQEAATGTECNCWSGKWGSVVGACLESAALAACELLG